ncbi:unnamed protein product [Clonostachys byssicola]|uniref:Uncharacterized protein n=1 Tax=Clonostachys byssicola TaxID=160290 RepID=A0A9N9U8W5_9HYPO|nr:unnamed protein product [Clonostachys byssicola]
MYSPQNQDVNHWIMPAFISVLTFFIFSVVANFLLCMRLESRRSNSNNSPDEERGAEPRDAAGRPFSALQSPPVPVRIHLNAINPWRGGHEEEEQVAPADRESAPVNREPAPVDREPAPRDGSSQDTLVEVPLDDGQERGQARAWWRQ